MISNELSLYVMIIELSLSSFWGDKRRVFILFSDLYESFCSLMFMGSSFSCVWSDWLLILSESLVFVMYLVALFCIFCSVLMLVVPEFASCVAGYSIRERICALYRCVLILVGADLNLRSLCMLMWALEASLLVCSLLLRLLLMWYPRTHVFLFVLSVVLPSLKGPSLLIL